MGAALAILAGAGPPCAAIAGPYSPAAGQPGSTAIDNDDPRIAAWATGWRDYEPGPGVDAAWRAPEEALGRAEGDEDGDPVGIVSLGRRGRITLTFAQAVVDGPGPDFAVFENGFSDRFLELAFIEASDDGIVFRRFASDSVTPGPVAGFDINGVDPTDVDGLAGKFRAGFGVPFDLADLGLARAVAVRVVDVAGDGGDLDSDGDPIYDPFPTEGSAGFDLDGIAVLHLDDRPPATHATYADWRVGVFGPADAADDGISGPFADPDADGSCNLCEYAAGADPVRADAGLRLEAAHGGGGGAIDCLFDRSPDPADLRLSLEVSDDGAAWREAAVRVGAGEWVAVEPGVAVDETGPAGGKRAVSVRVRLPREGVAVLARLRVAFVAGD